MAKELMKVNPNDLVIDLPVDDAHVAELMESIKLTGLQEEPHIWLNGMRIINGFHRVVACQRLGMTEIDCIVNDCNEEAFWDSRIIAAKPHKSISNERLAVWILDSWKASQWHKTIDLEKIEEMRDRLVFVPVLTNDPVRLALAESLWSSDNSDLAAWFEEKAKKWGINVLGILDAIGFSFLRRYCDKNTREGEIVSSVNNLIDLTAIEASAVAYQARLVDREFHNPEDSNEVIAQWVLNARQGGKESLHDYSQRVLAKKQAEERRRAAEEREKEDRRYQEWKKTPAGMAELHKENLLLLDRKIDAVFDSLERLEISEFPESLRRLTSLISAIENKMEEAFPDHVKKTKVNPFIAENIELRRQLQEQQRKIESLERALSSKQASTKGLPQAAALSSSEIELMAN